MHKVWALAAASLALLSAPAQAQDKLTLGLKWLPQAQFAGYYAAKARGFYNDENLDVTIKPGGLDPAPAEMAASGAADVVVDWMPAALAARERGIPLVNIAQIFKQSGMWLTCRRDAGVLWPRTLEGRTVAVWFGGNEYPFLAWMAKLGIPPGAVKVVKQGFDIKPLTERRADCISTMSYNEYWDVIDAGLKPEDLTVFKYGEHEVATLEDGLYVLEAKLADPKMRDRLARFLRASIRGWLFAAGSQKLAVAMIMKETAANQTTVKHQTRMLAEVTRLLDRNRAELGRLAPADYERTVTTLLAGGSDPVITKRPTGAWTHAIWDAAKKKAE